MPAVYTHYIVARETFKSLPHDIQEELQPHLSLYFFGAQGPDFCFFYKLLPPKRNFGSFLHQKGILNAFRVLKALAVTPQQLAYALGYVTHYAADVCFHPFVYENTDGSLLRHTRLEGTMDGYFKSAESSADPYLPYFSQKLRKEERNELFLAYAAIAAKCNLPPLNKKDFLRALSLFNAYLPIPNALPKYRGELQKEEVNGLKIGAIALAVRLCEDFFNAAKKRAPLSKELFGKSYLTGLLESSPEHNQR